MADPATLYRLIILYLLNESALPLSNTQITDFLQGKDYTDYFTVQNSISLLKESDLIRSEGVHGNTLYRITEEGRETLQFYLYRISEGIRKDVHIFLKENASEIHREASVRSDYRRTSQGSYMVHCVRSENDSTLIDLSFQVSSKEAAESVCRNWAEKSEDVFCLLADELIR